MVILFIILLKFYTVNKFDDKLHIMFTSDMHIDPFYCNKKMTFSEQLKERVFTCAPYTVDNIFKSANSEFLGEYVDPPLSALAGVLQHYHDYEITDKYNKIFLFTGDMIRH